MTKLNNDMDNGVLGAAMVGDYKKLQELAEQGEDLNVANEYGNTPAHMAAGGGHLKCLEVLAKHGANLKSLNKDGWTPAHSAAYHGERECMGFLTSKVRMKLLYEIGELS